MSDKRRESHSPRLPACVPEIVIKDGVEWQDEQQARRVTNPLQAGKKRKKTEVSRAIGLSQ